MRRGPIRPHRPHATVSSIAPRRRLQRQPPCSAWDFRMRLSTEQGALTFPPAAEPLRRTIAAGAMRTTSTFYRPLTCSRWLPFPKRLNQCPRPNCNHHGRSPCRNTRPPACQGVARQRPIASRLLPPPRPQSKHLQSLGGLPTTQRQAKLLQGSRRRLTTRYCGYDTKEPSGATQ